MNTPGNDAIQQLPRKDVKQSDDKLHIFVSYKSSDETIATSITKKLFTYGGPRLHIFLSAQSIGKGDKWNEEIHKALKQADWLVFIYTNPSREWDWCLYETGFFAGKAQPGSFNRLVCLYAVDAEPPEPLKEWQAVPATEDDIKALLKEIYSEPPRPGVEAVRPDAIEDGATEWLTDCASLIAKTLKPAPKQKCYSKHLVLTLNEMQIKKFKEGGQRAIPGDARLDGDFDDNALNLFNLARGEFRWSEFSGILAEKNQDVWIDDLCKQLSKILAREELEQQSLPTFTTIKGRNFYCPVIHRSELVEGGDLKLWLLFLPTSMPPSKEVTHTHPHIRIVYGDRNEVVEATPEAEKLYGRSPLVGTSLNDIISILTENMEGKQKDAFETEQYGLIGKLGAGAKSLEAQVCVTFAAEPERAYLPMITRYFTRRRESFIDVIYLDVSKIAKSDENGVKVCRLFIGA